VLTGEIDPAIYFALVTRDGEDFADLGALIRE
jgi:hypothetical protein